MTSEERRICGLIRVGEKIKLEQFTKEEQETVFDLMDAGILYIAEANTTYIMADPNESNKKEKTKRLFVDENKVN